MRLQAALTLPREHLDFFDPIGVLGDVGLDGDHMKHVEAIIHSMTADERRKPEIIGGSRRRRIAKGSGTSAQEVNQLLNQFRQMQKMMKQMTTGKGSKKMRRMMRQAGGSPFGVG